MKTLWLGNCLTGVDTLLGFELLLAWLVENSHLVKCEFKIFCKIP